MRRNLGGLRLESVVLAVFVVQLQHVAVVVDDLSLTLLNNGDFEQGDFSGWTEFGGVVQEVKAAVWAANSETHGAWLKGFNSDQDGGFYQDVAGFPGYRYTLDGYTELELNFPANDGQVDLELLFLDGSGSEISRQTTTVDTNMGFTLQSVTGVAPALTETVRVQVHWSTGTALGGSQESAQVDDLLLTVDSNLLFNSGFEEGDLSSWAEFGTAAQNAQPSDWAAYSGTYGLWMKGFVPNQDGGIRQDVPAVAGRGSWIYTLSYCVKIEDNFPANGGSVDLDLIFLNSSGAELHRETATAAVNMGWTQFTVSASAPALTASVRAQIHWIKGAVTGFGQESAEADDLVLTALPGGTLVRFR